MMTQNQLREHDSTLQAMARTGHSFKDIPGWVLHVVKSNDRFDAHGYPPDSEEMKQLRYTAIRQHCEAKKECFANTQDNFTPSRRLGETYGYTLKEPYLESEVTAYEDVALGPGGRLPDELRDYLLRVSRELYTDGYPVVFDLTETDVGTCCIPDGVDWFNGYDQDGCDCDDDDNDKPFRRVEDGMVTIGCCGCAFSKLIVVKGNRRGTVWRSDG